MISINVEIFKKELLKNLNAQIDYFSPLFWINDSERKQFPWGPLVELLQIINTLTEEDILKYFDLDKLAIIGRELWNHRFPFNPYILLGRSILSDLCIRNNKTRILWADIRNNDTIRATEEPLLWCQIPQLERDYLAECLQKKDSSLLYKSSLISYLKARSEGRLNDRVSAYYLTHLIIYCTNYGKRNFFPLHVRDILFQDAQAVAKESFSKKKITICLRKQRHQNAPWDYMTNTP